MSDDSVPRRQFLLRAGLAGTALAAGLSRSRRSTAASSRHGSACSIDGGRRTLREPDSFGSGLHRCRGRHAHPRRRALAIGQRLRRRRLHRPPARQRLGRRREAVSRGPVPKGKPEQGYQLALTPREFFAAGIAAANDWTRKTYGKDFDRLAAAERDAALKAMEDGKAEFEDFTSARSSTRLQITMEGFFADPIYGGNRDKVGWKMVGFPGLPATYADKIDAYRGKNTSPTRNRSPTSREREAAMATRLKEIDAVVIGMGLTGASWRAN